MFYFVGATSSLPNGSSALYGMFKLKLKSSLSGSTISHLDTCNSMECAVLFWAILFSKRKKIRVFWVFKSPKFQNRILFLKKSGQILS
jgi:hypothetical protein